MHVTNGERSGPHVLARGRGSNDFQVELLQASDGSVSVAFGLDSDGGALREWPAGDIEHGVRTFLSLVRRRSIN